METELYKKVFIRSEADLPKGHGAWFAVHSKETNENDTHNCYWLGDLYKRAWLGNYDWYLLPVASTVSKETPTAFEWHNYETGHAYVDYIPHVNQNEKDGYTKIPLYKLNNK